MTILEALCCAWKLYRLIRRHAIRLDKVISKLEELAK